MVWISDPASFGTSLRSTSTASANEKWKPSSSPYLSKNYWFFFLWSRTQNIFLLMLKFLAWNNVILTFVCLFYASFQVVKQSSQLTPEDLIPLATLSSGYGMRASNCEQSVKIGGEGYFDVTNAIGRGARAANDRSAVNATYLQHNSRKCCILWKICIYAYNSCQPRDFLIPFQTFLPFTYHRALMGKVAGIKIVEETWFIRGCRVERSGLVRRCLVGSCRERLSSVVLLTSIWKEVKVKLKLSKRTLAELCC